jgi:hypothetical protein
MVAKLDRNSVSCASLLEVTPMNCSTAEDCLRTVTPLRCTSCGSRARMPWTRLFTFTVLMSGLVPSAKVTLSVYVPSFALLDRM